MGRCPRSRRRAILAPLLISALPALPLLRLLQVPRALLLLGTFVRLKPADVTPYVVCLFRLLELDTYLPSPRRSLNEAGLY